MLKAGRITRIVNFESWSELAELDSQLLLISARSIRVLVTMQDTK